MYNTMQMIGIAGVKERWKDLCGMDSDFLSREREDMGGRPAAVLI